MRCRLCGDPAGWLRRTCRDCRLLWRAWQTNRAAGMRQLLRAFGETAVAAEKIERFLDAEPRRGRGTVRDHVAADMANQLLDALGQPPTQSSEGTRRLRERGQWRHLDERPEE